MAEEEVVYGKTSVKITNPDKLYWPDEKITKGDVINYYRSISEVILPYLKGRPQSLRRNPNGVADKGFYQKDAGKDAPFFVKTISVYSASSKRDVEYILCNNAATLTYLNNLGCIEINPWHSVVGSPGKPTYLVIDIDPSEKNTTPQIIETVQAIYEVLQKGGVDAYCKTSGASGMHIYVPLGRKYTYEQARDFAHLVCMLANELVPDFTTLERNLKKRGKDHIYLDYLQNGEGQTIASVYSVRPYAGATVSTPLDWKEIKQGLAFYDFTIHSMAKRLKKKGDLFLPVLGKGINLAKCLKSLGA